MSAIDYTANYSHLGATTSNMADRLRGAWPGMSEKKPKLLKIVQDDQRLTINLVDRSNSVSASCCEEDPRTRDDVTNSTCHMSKSTQQQQSEQQPKRSVLKSLRASMRMKSSGSKNVPKEDVHGQNVHLKEIITEAGDNWMHLFMPIIQLGDLDSGREKTNQLVGSFNVVKGDFERSKMPSERVPVVHRHLPVPQPPMRTDSIQRSDSMNASQASIEKTKSITISNNRMVKESLSAIESKSDEVISVVEGSSSLSDTKEKPSKLSAFNRNGTNSHNKSNSGSNKKISLVKTTSSYVSEKKSSSSSDSNSFKTPENRIRMLTHHLHNAKKLDALKNEIDKTMNEINMFKNEVFGHQSHFEASRMQQTTPKIMQDASVNTDISMCNAVFKIKYEDEPDDDDQVEEEDDDDDDDDYDDDEDHQVNYATKAPFGPAIATNPNVFKHVTRNKIGPFVESPNDSIGNTSKTMSSSRDGRLVPALGLSLRNSKLAANKNKKFHVNEYAKMANERFVPHSTSHHKQPKKNHLPNLFTDEINLLNDDDEDYEIIDDDSGQSYEANNIFKKIFTRHLNAQEVPMPINKSHIETASTVDSSSDNNSSNKINNNNNNSETTTTSTNSSSRAQAVRSKNSHRSVDTKLLLNEPLYIDDDFDDDQNENRPTIDDNDYQYYNLYNQEDEQDDDNDDDDGDDEEPIDQSTSLYRKQIDFYQYFQPITKTPVVDFSIADPRAKLEAKTASVKNPPSSRLGYSKSTSGSRRLSRHLKDSTSNRLVRSKQIPLLRRSQTSKNCCCCCCNCKSLKRKTPVFWEKTPIYRTITTTTTTTVPSMKSYRNPDMANLAQAINSSSSNELCNDVSSGNNFKLTRHHSANSYYFKSKENSFRKEFGCAASPPSSLNVASKFSSRVNYHQSNANGGVLNRVLEDIDCTHNVDNVELRQISEEDLLSKEIQLNLNKLKKSLSSVDSELHAKKFNLPTNDIDLNNLFDTENSNLKKNRRSRSFSKPKEYCRDGDGEVERKSSSHLPRNPLTMHKQLHTEELIKKHVVQPVTKLTKKHHKKSSFHQANKYYIHFPMDSNEKSSSADQPLLGATNSETNYQKPKLDKNFSFNSTKNDQQKLHRTKNPNLTENPSEPELESEPGPESTILLNFYKLS